MMRLLVALGIAVAVSFAAAPQDAPAAPACDRQPVMQIDSAKVDVVGNKVAIFAFGTSESAGWKDPTLVVRATADGVAEVEFVACRPEVSAQVLTPIQVQQTLDLGPSVRRVVIRARTNSMTIDIKRE